MYDITLIKKIVYIYRIVVYIEYNKEKKTFAYWINPGYGLLGCLENLLYTCIENLKRICSTIYT